AEHDDRERDSCPRRRAVVLHRGHALQRPERQFWRHLPADLDQLLQSHRHGRPRQTRLRELHALARARQLTDLLGGCELQHLHGSAEEALGELTWWGPLGSVRSDLAGGSLAHVPSASPRVENRPGAASAPSTSWHDLRGLPGFPGRAQTTAPARWGGTRRLDT